MADETTQQQTNVAQPMQQVNIDYKSYTLKGAEIYGKMMPLSENARDYTSEKMAGEQFYLYKFKGAAVAVSPAFHQAFRNYELVEVTLTGSLNPRVVADPNSPGGKKTIDSQAYGLDGCITTATQIKMLKLEESQKTYERAKKTISKIDVTKELTQEELDELIEKS